MKACPIDHILPSLKEALSCSSSVVLHAPPGAGKTTRVPLALLESVPPGQGRIIMLEPRRIAAVSAARWMAQTIGEQVGETVGYTIRFDRRVSDKTRIEVVTEGILTRRIQTDPTLEGVAMIIFDEFHERSIHADLALALCLDIRKGLRTDMKLLIMSATLDCGPIAALLGNAPVISSCGKAFSVEERYIGETGKRPLKERITDAVVSALKETSGDILVFLPGSGEIRQCSDVLRKSIPDRSGNISVHPLYGDLPFEEQEQAILPSPRRKIVLATNIAETSLTIEGVTVVIDSGLTRRLQYDPSTGMNRLITVNVSRASAEQRKGRAGRLAPGVCYRLYSRHVFQSMIPFTPPEILVSDLSSLLLELALWGVKEPSMLAWLDAPPVSALESARHLLYNLGGIDESHSVTALGRKVARLPLHPRLGRLLLRAVELGCPRLGADLAAIVSERDIIQRSPSVSGEPDIGTRIEMLYAWRRTKELPYAADLWGLRAVDRTSSQLLRLIAETGNADGDRHFSDPDMVPRILLSAFPDRIAKRREEVNGCFLLSQGRGVRLPAESALAGSPYIVAVNLDAGVKTEGRVHIAASLSEPLIRQECGSSIKTLRRIEWDKRERRVIAASEERLGALLLSVKTFSPAADEVLPIICEAIRNGQATVSFSSEAKKFRARLSLVRRAFPQENLPDLSDENLLSKPEEWLLPWLGSMRTAKDLLSLDLLPALRAQLSWRQQQFLDEQAPTHLSVPSGSRIAVDYAAGDTPVLAVKLQELFGLADTPTIAGGSVKILLHLLSPARRPVQVTQDLEGFWNSGYQQVRKELKGRYPKHPWPEDPWNAPPTRRLKPRST
ncbi:MAG: ATP-dependent helicase HrpB [Nitrospirae bacterium]|nr:ATP-dependent helicase HrpB [Nitrospirota bacterium]